MISWHEICFYIEYRQFYTRELASPHALQKLPAKEHFVFAPELYINAMTPSLIAPERPTQAPLFVFI